MCRPLLHIHALAFGLAVLCASAAAQEQSLPTKLHPWGAFEPGTWKAVRVITETFNEQGQVVSTTTTDTKTTLQGVDKTGVTLEVETCVEVAGKRFQSEPQVVKQGLYGETTGSAPTFKEPVDGEATIDGRKIACKTVELRTDGPAGKTAVTLQYSTMVPPYVLKRTTVTTDAEGKTTNETNTEVLALDMPMRIQGATRSGVYVKTVHKTAKTVVTTVAVIMSDVPGGVVSQSSKEVDKDGRLVRRSTLELLDYNADPDKDYSGVFGRKRPPRRPKTPPRHNP